MKLMVKSIFLSSSYLILYFFVLLFADSLNFFKYRLRNQIPGNQRKTFWKNQPYKKQMAEQPFFIIRVSFISLTCSLTSN